tara:strand:- start:901 stop:1215 length:315 start_codon:yes stop_codon:yes gene_type:complete
MRKTFVIDLDHTLCHTVKDGNGRWRYFEAQPYYDRIDRVNDLWEDGNRIIIETARGCNSKINYYEDTFEQLRLWGLKFDLLRTGVKFGADYYIDDKAINSEDFF